jgi:hypothetical protein
MKRMSSACAAIRAGVLVRVCELPWVMTRACSVPFDAVHSSVLCVLSSLVQITQGGSALALTRRIVLLQLKLPVPVNRYDTRLWFMLI